MDDPALRSSDTNAFGGKNSSKSKSNRVFSKTTGEKVTTPTSKSASTTIGKESPKTDAEGNYVLSSIEQN